MKKEAWRITMDPTNVDLPQIRIGPTEKLAIEIQLKFLHSSSKWLHLIGDYPFFKDFKRMVSFELTKENSPFGNLLFR